MFKANKIQTILWLTLALIACLALTLTGCSREGTLPSAGAPTLTAPVPAAAAPTAQEIVKNTLDAMSKLTSFQFALDLKAKISGNVDKQAQNMTVAAAGNGSSDVTAHNMQVNLMMDIETANQTKMSTPVVFYLVDGWQYMKAVTPFTGEQWLKMKTDHGSAAFRDQSAQAMDMLKSAVEVTLQGNEEVDGESCYVLAVNPDLAVISEWLQSFQSTSGLQSQAVANMDLAKFVKNLSIKEYVIRDSFLLKKCEISAGISLNGADFGKTGHEGDNLAMEIAQTLSMSGYNQPVAITLPPEAADARDMSGFKPGKTGAP
jgi:hypothetical protein